jgi:sulfatase modifying factor 1
VTPPTTPDLGGRFGYGSLSFSRLTAAASLCLAAAGPVPGPARAVTIEWSTVVSSTGNAPDPATGGAYGRVNHEYRIGKYEVTIGQYTEFLNAVDPNGSNPYGLYNSIMASWNPTAGINFVLGSPSGQKYIPIGTATRPVTFVSWFDAARFANWMHNGQGGGSTETGAYTLVGGQTNGTAPAKNASAQFYIPTENEWYKAAYFSPALNSGAGGYYTYATQSNSAPGNIIGGGVNQANYRNGAGFSVTQSLLFNASLNYLTDVGAFTNSPSFYGTFDQAGNVSEWNDLTEIPDTSRGFRGGAWFGTNGAVDISSSGHSSMTAADKIDTIGFRLAAPVPEPSTWVMAAGGIACAARRALRRKRP